MKWNLLASTIFQNIHRSRLVPSWFSLKDLIGHLYSASTRSRTSYIYRWKANQADGFNTCKGS